MMTLLILLLALALAGDVLLGVLLWRSGRAPGRRSGRAAARAAKGD